MYGWMQPESAGASHREPEREGETEREREREKEQREVGGDLNCGDYFYSVARFLFFFLQQ